MRKAAGNGRFARSSSGSVSIYLIAATAAFVLITALLIDFSRIMAFRKQAELAVQSGARSVLSSYDPAMYARYGLFIRGGEDADELLRRTLDGHFPDGRSAGQAFPYLDAAWEESGVTESRPLADHEVFTRQMLEEMKYKAPIDLTLELAKRFRGVSSAMKEATDTVDLLEKMRKAFDRREAALDEALAEQEQGGKRIVSELRELAPHPPVSLNGGLSAGDVRHMADAALKYADYVAKRQADDEAERAFWEANAGQPIPFPVVIRRYTAVIAAYESGCAALAAALGRAAERVRSAGETSYSRAAEALRKAEAANEEMRGIAAQAAKYPAGSGSGDSGDESSVDAEKVGALADIRRSAEQLVLEGAFFDAYFAEINAQRDRGASLALDAGSASSVASSAPGSVNREAALRESARKLQSTLNEYAQAYGADGAVIRQRRDALQQQRAHEEERKALEREADREWSGWSGWIGGIRSLQGSPEERETFAKADRLYRDNLAWNKQQDALPADPFGAGSASDGRDAAMAGSNAMLDALDGSLAAARDSLFFAEYVYARMSRFPPAQVKQLLGGGQADVSLPRQETEYVLYGFANPSGNLAAAYGEIFAFRLAIRTMEGLIECRGAGHPLLILAGALLYGVRNALQDMRLLLDRDAVPLSKYLKVETSYADYLRLFLLLQGGTSNRLSRSLAVMASATGLNFAETYTYASAEGTASLRLWFFPGLLRLLGREGSLGGTIKGNRYEATYVADHAYQ